MRNLINQALQAARKYNVWEWGMLKICLFSLGVIVCAVFYPFFSKYLFVVCIVFGAIWVWLVYRTFIKYWGK
jgi:hypothetical protein